jgi:hypothetical protein
VLYALVRLTIRFQNLDVSHLNPLGVVQQASIDLPIEYPREINLRVLSA